MNRQTLIAVCAVMFALLLFLNRKTIGMKISTYSILTSFLPKWEGFSATPYWDVKQWSWGYGTRVPGSGTDPKTKPAKTITRAQAIIDTVNHLTGDETYLKSLIKVPLSGAQWAALLSFSYNLGRGNADNLVANINARNWSALRTQWAAYNKVQKNGALVVSQHHAERRAAEWALFAEDI